MSNVVPGQNWDRFKKLDIGELNQLNSDVFESRYDDEQSITTTLAQVFSDHYSYDITSGTGPYAAVVLDVLSGPQVKNEATTGHRVNTTSLNIDDYPYPFWQDRKDLNKKLPVVVKAKIPEFDVDIDWPRDKEDKARIDAHGEFFQFKDDDDLTAVDVGSVIWVSFNSSKNKVSINGRPVGKIIGVHTPAVISDVKTKISPRLSMNPDCKTAKNKKGPAGGLYVGNTDPNPNPNIGPPISKIKGNINTGIFGNGSAQTKAHFEEALKKSLISSASKIKGPAPGAKNAFIWIGHLKNNGYMDILDRPISQGRETIIYAPMTLDLGAPIEIKYYFHNKGGFGHAWINGPSTNISDAVKVPDTGNDFKEKIGPGIKDLNAQGRNYVLVIPEMSYSRGYGTPNGAKDRISKLSSGENVGPGKITGGTIRTKVNAETRTALKSYLNNLPIEQNKNLLHITPLREREFSTFDGSFTGGKFGDFHQEVIDVLSEHIGTVHNKIDYISFLADGYGSLALSGITNKVLASSTHAEAEASFRNVLIGKKVRIDYITDEKLESPDNFVNFFGITPAIPAANIPSRTRTPSYSFYENFLKYRMSNADQGYTEFNYITSPTTKKQNLFFDYMGKIEEYKKNVSSAGGLGKNAFFISSSEIRVSDPGDNTLVDANPGVGISMHVSSNPAGYAFTMINDSISTFDGLPLKPDANTRLRESFSAVPNHAYILSTKPAAGDLEKINKKQKELEESINYFENLINDVLYPPADFEEFDYPCQFSKYKMYCDNGTFVTSPKSAFFSNYIDFLENKKQYAQLSILAEHEIIIQKIINNKNSLIKEKNRVQKLKIQAEAAESSTSANSNQTSLSLWQTLNTNFSFLRELWMAETSTLDLFGDSPDKGLVAQIALAVSRKEAYEKVLSKLKSAIDNASPDAVVLRPDCEPPPKKIEEYKVETPKVGKSSEPGNNCGDLKISVPNTFEELVKMIPYYPKKSEFVFKGRSSKTKTKIHLVEGYKTSKFKYSARGTSGGITQKESPLVWACLADIIENGMKVASTATGYYPFEVTTGIRGLQNPKTAGTTAYTTGVSLHSFGLAIDLDPFIAGYSKSRGRQVHSVYTGAWTPGFIDVHGKQLYELGVFSVNPRTLTNNAYEADNRPRLAENWAAAPSRYRGGGESGTGREKYKKIMEAAKGAPIVPAKANPTLWILIFCETTGMKWGNGKFLKKRYKGGSSWSQEEQQLISKIYSIDDVVNRIQAISWNTRIEDHMHIHYWGNQSNISKSLVSWREINKVPKPGGGN